MKKLLIISFDLIRQGESNTSLSIGSILSFIKQDEQYGDKFIAEHLSINMLSGQHPISKEYLYSKLAVYDFQK